MMLVLALASIKANAITNTRHVIRDKAESKKRTIYFKKNSYLVHEIVHICATISPSDRHLFGEQIVARERVAGASVALPEKRATPSFLTNFRNEERENKGSKLRPSYTATTPL